MVEPTAAEPAPTCYRHTGRETWVRCTRCDRPICPDCMHDAAVGFQCPECVREGQRSMRAPRTAFGGRVGADGTITKVLIGVNVLAFLVQLGSQRFTDTFDLVSIDVAAGEYYRLMTAAFLHANPIHIALNMYALLLFGTTVEQTLGRSRYVALYALSAFGGSTVSYLVHAPVSVQNGQISVFGGLGASGAVFGLLGAYFVIARRMRADTTQIVVLVAINLVLGFAMRDVIDNFAHLGGLATGGLVTYALAKVPPGPRRTKLQALSGAAVGVLLVGLVALRTADLRDRCPAVGTPSAVISCLQSGAAPSAR